MISGTIVPPLTPFTDDLKVDFAALGAGVDYVVERCRASMVIAAGVEAQEYQYLTFEERKDLIRATVERVDGRRPVAVGISHPSFKVAVALAHFAEELGASALQLLAPLKPTGGAPTTAELVRYFELVARETRLPIMLYLNAGPGADVSIPATIELAKLDRVKFIKESSRDLARVSRLIAEIELAGHARYFTTMQMLLITLQLGGSGITLPPPAAEIARHAIDAFAAGDTARAIALQKQFATFPNRWMGNGLAAVMKAASTWLGVPAGLPYPPYAPVSGADLEALHAYLATTALASPVPAREPADA
ncbi:dihydrodipicolinate synthase family protein [Xanthobacter sp. V4C-4]|uniref:dihydrodipicolinate synthase family protein n=1 Tax=Xanthobacter cornucopiae TaxID=3119924 RepID=UPI003726D3A3